MDLRNHLKRLCAAHGPSGHESAIRELLQIDWEPLVDSFEVGGLGSLVGIKRGTGSADVGLDRLHRRIMLSAHIDEIGMIIHHIDGAFIRVSKLGGIDARTLPGQPVIVHCDPPLRGVIGVPPLHTLSDDQRANYMPLIELVVDVGLTAEEVQQRIHVGDIVTLDVTLIELGTQRVTGKALDDRACIAVISACLDALQSRRHSWDVLAVASIQEEVGSYGAMTEAYRLNPDLAIALDVTFANQAGVSQPTFSMNGTPPLGLGANFHPALYRAIRAAGQRIEMDLRRDPIPMRSGTDAWPIQISQEGIPTALVQVPLRNMHSTVETIDMRDIERAGRLLAEFISGLDNSFMDTIAWDIPKTDETA